MAIKETRECEVEEVLDRRTFRNKREYLLVMWKGYPGENGRWEGAKSLGNARGSMAEFENWAVQRGESVSRAVL
jgi:hypothetical protein